MNETVMTVRGNLVEAPTLRQTRTGHHVANFRVASTQRRFDRDQGGWVDGPTLYVTVTAWRGLALNVCQSLSKGEPVIVYGRYFQREYKKDEQLKTAYELEAMSVGPDLTRGISRFEKVNRTAAPALDVDETGAPADVTHEYLNLDENVSAGLPGGASGSASGATADRTTDGDVDDGGGLVPASVDPVTGEVRELASA